MLLATLDSFLGSLWFAGLAAIVGYIGGHVFPISALAEKFKK
jgi:hypothetical protein